MIYTLILENREYNPKIDYFVCKNLAEGLERGYYEEHIRAVYHKEESAKSDFEFMMIKIKEIFKLNDINNNAPMIVNNLYQCITNSNIDISFQLNDFSYLALKNNYGKFQRCPFNVGKPFFRWGYVILSQNKSDLVVF